ncbi:MAG TPA: hypothetical protein DEF12_04825 [Rhodobacteraceae bacterium]|nr:hypothetical protein [Paracoccaceae bacterium]HBV54343.1 hypothetical protein [Paracoccaceae bacterium]
MGQGQDSDKWQAKAKRFGRGKSKRGARRGETQDATGLVCVWLVSGLRHDVFPSAGSGQHRKFFSNNKKPAQACLSGFDR